MAANEYYPDVGSDEEARLPDDLAGLTELLVWAALSYAWWLDMQTPSSIRSKIKPSSARLLRAKVNVHRIATKIARVLDKEVSATSERVKCLGYHDPIPRYVLEPPGRRK